MRKLLLGFILVLVTALGLTGCISDDVTTSPSDILTFSADTVNFDTVFTDLGTPTARLKVYNKAKKAVNISSIKFANPVSNFFVNVDGVSGTRFEDVEIRGGDSIFVFIECFIPEELQKNGPFLVEDKLQFVTNGVTQDVVVEAYGQNVKRLYGLTVTENMTLTADMPYVVFDSLTVAPGATLSIEPGVDLLFHDKAKMTVYGTLQAKGAPGKMINMRGDRLDNVLPDVPYDILAGQWDGIRIAAESFDNSMEYVDMRSTRIGLQIDSCGNLTRQKMVLLNSWLHNSQTSALQSKYAWVDAYGCVFSEAAYGVVELTGGIHEFTQCTFSNYYLYAYPTDPLLCVYHLFPKDLEDNANDLMKARFRNCILYGLPADINEGDLTGSEVFLEYCSLKSNGDDDYNFVACLWDTDPLFLTVREDYIFNYHLEEESPVIGAGNPQYITRFCLYDMDGLNRLSDGNPTLGAFCR